MTWNDRWVEVLEVKTIRGNTSQRMGPHLATDDRTYTEQPRQNRNIGAVGAQVRSAHITPSGMESNSAIRSTKR